MGKANGSLRIEYVALGDLRPAAYNPRKIEEAALAHGQMPALVIEFNDDGKKVMEVAVVPTWVLENVE